MNYAKTVLKMQNPYDYFQAGVLVLNTKAMREHYTIEQWLAYASNPDSIYNDQDVLNAHCEGNVLYLRGNGTWCMTAAVVSATSSCRRRTTFTTRI